MTEWLKHRLRCESRNSSISYFDAIFFKNSDYVVVYTWILLVNLVSLRVYEDLPLVVFHTPLSCRPKDTFCHLFLFLRLFLHINIDVVFCIHIQRQ